jgi:hypothetical protein
MHSLHDGCVLRAFTDPALNDPNISDSRRVELRKEYVRAAASAVFELAWTYSVPGSLADPRSPKDDDVDASELFDRLVGSAIDLCRSDRAAVPTPEQAAQAIRVDPDVMCKAYLNNVMRASNVCPSVVDMAANSDQEGSETTVLNELEGFVVEALQAVGCADPGNVASSLIGIARAPESGAVAIDVFLKSHGLSTGTVARGGDI